MPDLLQHRIINLPDTPVTVNRFAVEYRMVDSQDQAVLRSDRLGANRLVWPDGLALLSSTQRRRVIEAAIREWITIEVEALG